jgi:tetratricopeptide (TPR) repeat protein
MGQFHTGVKACELPPKLSMRQRMKKDTTSITKKNMFLKKYLFCNIVDPSEVKVRRIIFSITIILSTAAVLFFSSCSARMGKSEFDFANKLAQQELWKEAFMRWERALAKGEDNAAIHNNMAIALEQMGKRDEAEKEYQKALKLSPNNSRIKGNYERFKSSLKEDKLEKDVEKIEEE